MDDKVIDSRMADGGSATRRRRECLACGQRYTTFERVEELQLLVVEAVRRPGAVRAGQDPRRHPPGGQEPAHQRGDIAALAAGVEDEVRELGPGGGERGRRQGRPGAAPPPRPGHLPAVRLGLQGLRGPHRLRAGSGAAAEDDDAERGPPTA